MASNDSERWKAVLAIVEGGWGVSLRYVLIVTAPAAVVGGVAIASGILR
jgi:hypothetical protein